ncbi:DUF4873 domain-containing protein [Nocardioides dubius]|uniref:DUF4873 domain-containing protein n=1 Tax=Nocardioides dubius TaxID=317019 RepID=A0ABN1TXP1_9ACTN
MSHHEPGAEYSGPATLSKDEQSRTLEVTLKGEVQPIDGLFHWYGRIKADADTSGLRSGDRVSLSTEHGSAEARLSDVDPWGRFRITGTGRPPF